MIGEVIYNILSNNTTVNTAVNGRIYPQFAPLETVFPLIVFTQVSKTPDNTKDGGSVIDTTRMQIDVYDKNHANTGLIAQQIRAALDGYEGVNNGHSIQSIYFERESEQFDGTQEVYRISTDYFIRENK